jgi:hypothetical protein
VGGITGDFATSAIIRNCYSTGNISAVAGTGAAYAGGITRDINGNNGSDTARIINCYATGNISASGGASSWAAGIVGETSNGIVQGCVARNGTITLSGGGADIHRVVATVETGGSYSSTLTNNYANSAMTLNGSTVSSADGTSFDGADVNLAATQSQAWWQSGPGFSFGANAGAPWKWSAALQRPVLYWE